MEADAETRIKVGNLLAVVTAVHQVVLLHLHRLHLLLDRLHHRAWSGLQQDHTLEWQNTSGQLSWESVVCFKEDLNQNCKTVPDRAPAKGASSHVQLFQLGIYL